MRAGAFDHVYFELSSMKIVQIYAIYHNLLLANAFPEWDFKYFSPAFAIEASSRLLPAFTAWFRRGNPM
jgi:hypothetical protein